jgi:hypothetical protein
VLIAFFILKLFGFLNVVTAFVMNNNKDKLIEKTTWNSVVYYRLIALWVICEAMLGGVIHGLRLPISGLLVGGSAVVIICLMARYTPKKGSILKAAIIVAIFKMMLSPQSPPTAYVAVFFQGFLAELVFFNSNFFKLSCFLLAVLSMLESAVQRILVLMIVYGTAFWKAVDAFISKLSNEHSITSYSYYFAIGYIVLHLIAGLIVGWICCSIPVKILEWKKTIIPFKNFDEPTTITQFNKSKKRPFKISLIVVWLVLIVFYIQSAIPIGKPILPSNLILQIIVRSLIIVLSWWLVFSPLLTKWLQIVLQRKQLQMPQLVKEITQLLPTIKSMVVQSWAAAKPLTGIKKLAAFIKTVTVNIIYAA